MDNPSAATALAALETLVQSMLANAADDPETLARIEAWRQAKLAEILAAMSRPAVVH